jgi:hypothetical protein
MVPVLMQNTPSSDTDHGGALQLDCNHAIVALNNETREFIRLAGILTYITILNDSPSFILPFISYRSPLGNHTAFYCNRFF